METRQETDGAPATVYKYEFPVGDTCYVTMPIGAKVISVGVQRERHICLWAVVNPEAETETRIFHVRGTGHPLRLAANNGSRFIGTVFDGPFVWHIFGVN